MKNAILISPPFFHYEDHIKKELEKKGYKVYYINHKKGRLLDALISFLPLQKQKKIYKKIICKRLKELPRGDIDLLLQIKGDYVVTEHIDFLKKENPNIKCIMYQWDSVANFNYLDLIDSFDNVYTFDFCDSSYYSIDYLPLFYTNDIVPNENIKEDIDLLLIGTFNPLRYRYYLKLKEIAIKNHLNLYSYIVVSPVYYIKKQLLTKELDIKSIKDIRFLPLSRKKLIDFYQRSKVIVDVCRPDQSGLSMRLIESFGMNKKVLTANEDLYKDPIVKDIVYLSIVSDEKDIVSFLQTPVKEYLNKSQLSITRWIDNILK